MTGAVPDPLPDWLAAARRVTVLTGAGVSTDSGIPDFRGPRGVWTRDPEAEKLSDIRWYVTDAGVRRRAWQERLHSPAWTARPNAAHAALVDLERQGRLRALITQNTDGLHQRAGSGRVLELHGTVHEVACLDCGDRGPMADALARVEAGEEDPPCLVCGGLLKSATVSFGQPLDAAVVDAAVVAAADCDVFLAAGTSLTVHPAAGLTDVAAGAGARVVVANAQPTPYDDLADLVVHDDLGTALPRLLGIA